ncbi:hypothetical protein K502DRAFT_352934 [Neoconidiobolus thromboides FSU 785]|nr:hypothetical protein K502DRAFT_352934 [Neoconidiobolus thromboides FSU 785]
MRLAQPLKNVGQKLAVAGNKVLNHATQKTEKQLGSGTDMDSKDKPASSKGEKQKEATIDDRKKGNDRKKYLGRLKGLGRKKDPNSRSNEKDEGIVKSQCTKIDNDKLKG